MSFKVDCHIMRTNIPKFKLKPGEVLLLTITVEQEV